MPWRTLVRGGLPTKRAWAYALVNPAVVVTAPPVVNEPWFPNWQPHRNDVAFVLRTIRAAYRLRHDPHVGQFARLALRAQFAALDTFDPTAPGFGVAAFPLAFQTFRGEWNALVGAHSKAQPRRAAQRQRRRGDKTRAAVKAAWDDDAAGDAKAGRPAHPVRGRIQRIAAALARSEPTIRAHAHALGLLKAKKKIKG